MIIRNNLIARKTPSKHKVKGKHIIISIFFWLLTIAAPIVWLGLATSLFVFENRFISDWYNVLVFFPVIFLAILHWIKDPILTALNNKYADIFVEKKTEATIMERQEIEYVEKHRKFSRALIIGKIGRWIHKNGIVFTILLGLIFVNATLIRSSNLGVLPLQNDEFLSYSAVKYIADGHIKFADLQYGSEVNQSKDFYSRALPYSLGAALTVKLLGGDYMDYANLRLFSVICGVLTVFIFYLLLRRYLTRPVLLFSLLGVSTFYLLVYYSRVARMYSLHVLLFFFMILIADRLFSKILTERITRYVGIGESMRYYFEFLKQNILSILLLIIALTIERQVHITGLVIIPTIFVYMLFHLRNHRQLFYPLLIIIIALAAYLIIIIVSEKSILNMFFNTSRRTYWEFLNYNFIYLYGGFLTIPLFLFPLTFIRQVPSIIKLFYTAFFVVVPAYIFMLNGAAFRDPRYMLFIYPLYVIIIVYSLYLLVAILFHKSNVLNNKYLRFGTLSVLFIFFVSPLQVYGVCRDLPFIVCPESHQSEIFHIDRWNYNHDEYYQIIKENITPDTIIASRSIYDFYIEKYILTNKVIKLADSPKPYIKKGANYSIADLKNSDVIFIDYPKLYYDSAMTAPYDQLYQYLLKKRTGKKVLYQSLDDKVIVYKITRSLRTLD